MDEPINAPIDEPIDEPTDDPGTRPPDRQLAEPVDGPPLPVDQESALRRRGELPRKPPDEGLAGAAGAEAEPSLLARIARSDIVGEKLEGAPRRVDTPEPPAASGRVDAAAAVGGDEPPDTDTTIDGAGEVEGELGPG
jgi:hypothetical protein